MTSEERPAEGETVENPNPIDPTPVDDTDAGATEHPEVAEATESIAEKMAGHERGDRVKDKADEVASELLEKAGPLVEKIEK